MPGQADTGGGRRRPTATDVVLLIAVAVAFADSSIVVLAVPEILADLDVDVDTASWVITAYNLAVTVAALLFLTVGRRLGPRVRAGVGFVAFGLASAGCALAGSIGPLIAFRAVQGAAAALVLVSALSLLGGRDAVRAWILAATVGLAAGPALGGLLTELFTWRSIFVVQAPLVAIGLVALRSQATVLPRQPVRRARHAWLADVVLAALSAALVGALFLVVVLLISGFGWQPLEAALAATTLPLFAAIAERAGRALPTAAAVASGGLLTAAGLAVLGLLPGAETGLVLAGLALCGTGLGLAAQPLGTLALSGGDLPRDSGWTVVARHAGLVVSLLVVTPVLVASLDQLERDAEGVGGEVVLRSQLPLRQKVPILFDLADASRTAETGLPDIAEVLDGYEDESVDRLAARLDGTLQDLVALAFREPFLVCAGFGLLSALLGLGLGAGRRRARAPAVLFVLLAVVAAGVSLGTAVRMGALDDRTAIGNPCTAPTTVRGKGTDAVTQRIALRALAGAACELGTTRVGVLRELTGEGPTRYTEKQLEDALQPRIVAAIDREREEGNLGETTAFLLRTLAQNASLGLIRQALSQFGG